MSVKRNNDITNTVPFPDFSSLVPRCPYQVPGNKTFQVEKGLEGFRRLREQLLEHLLSRVEGAIAVSKGKLQCCFNISFTNIQPKCGCMATPKQFQF